MATEGGRLMKRLTLALFLTAAALGVLLFKVKYEVIDLESELNQVNRSIVDHQEAIHILKAEWAHLNEPARLKRLANEYLGLTPMGPEHLGSFSDLPRRNETTDPNALPTSTGGRQP